MQRNNNSAVRQFGKLLWYDPNPTDNEPINLEDLTISVDLKVTSKTRSVIIVNNNTGTFGVNSTGTQLMYNVGFLEGSLNTYNGKKNTLTTNYSDLQDLNGAITDENSEVLGIDSINIDFNSSYAPTIKIKFIDVRGAAIFSSGGKNKYKFFFEMPYPLFNLTIKGYYGKAVNYCLHLLRFNASFNSQTGNFEIDCDFIGYTYALLADMLMGLVRASVTTTKGKAIFKTIKAEYKNQANIITLDELVKKISDVNGVISKIKSGENTKNLAENEKIKQEVDNLKTIILKHLDDYASSGSKLFTNSYSNGTLIMSYPSNIDSLKIKNKTYRDTISAKVQEIGDSIGFDTTDPNRRKIIDLLDPDKDRTFKYFRNWLDYGLDQFKVSEITPDTKLTQRLTAKYWDGSRLTRMKNLLKTINFRGYENLLIMDMSKAINTCNEIQVLLETENNSQITKATTNLRNDIRSTLGFDPTIRNLFRILCISTEVFLQSILEISQEAEKDANNKRAAALSKLRLGLDINNSSNKVFPWPEYRKSSRTSDGFYEEWMGNEPIPIADVPELRFTEELLGQMINQAREDKFREGQLNVDRSWYPISVIDVPIDNGLSATMIDNPYKIALLNDRTKVFDTRSNSWKVNKQPQRIKEEALRALMYRGFLLLGVVNRNNISDDMIKLHAKLEAENLYDVLLQMTDVGKAKIIRDGIKNMSQTPSNGPTSGTDEIYDMFKDGVNKLPKDFPNKNFFEESDDELKYTQIIDNAFGRAYIPINGNFDTNAFHISRGNLKDPSEILKLRRDGNILFVGNHSNHTRIVNKSGTFGASDGDVYTNVGNYDSLDNNRERWNFLSNDGAVNVKIISANSFANGGLSPNFGGSALNGVDNPEIIRHKDINKAIKDITDTTFYTNPIRRSTYLANSYTKMDYSAGANESNYSCDNYTGINALAPGGTTSTFISFFNQAGDISSVKNSNTNKVYKKYELCYNGFAGKFINDVNEYGWYGERNDFGDNFQIENNLAKLEIKNYKDYGRNREILNNALEEGGEIYIPKIEFCVDDYISYNLFGSKFYYYQNSMKPALKNSNDETVVTIGDAGRAFLFLHCFPFQGVTRKGGNEEDGGSKGVFDRFMFDYNNAKSNINETTTFNKKNSNPEVLGIKGLFRFHNAFIEAPKIWTLFIGAILWRMKSYIDNNANDPIEWYVLEDPDDVDSGKIWFIPNMKPNKNPRVDEYLTVVKDADYLPAGIRFYTSNNAQGNVELPYAYVTSNGLLEDYGHYSRVDETLIGLPSQIKAEFINNFLQWAGSGSGFGAIQEQLEIDFDFNPDNAGTIKYLQGQDGYIDKWKTLKNSVTKPNQIKDTNNITYDTYNNKFLKVSQVETALGANIIDNYIHVCPVYDSDANDTVNEHRLITGDRKYNTGIYVNGQYAYNMELHPKGRGMQLIRELLLEKVYIQNVRPDAWVAPNLEINVANKGKKKPSYTPITVNKDKLKLFLNTFKSHFDTISDNLNEVIEAEVDAIQRELFKTMDDDKIKLNIYRILMSIYQKWIGGINGTMFTQCSVNPSDITIAEHERNNDSPRLIDSFRFLDRSFNDIGDTFYVNPQFFYSVIKNNRNSSFFDIANKILSDNNFNFIPLPAFVNFNKPEELKEIFEPYPYLDSAISGPSFVCVYAGQASSHLDLGDTSNYPDDGIFVTIDEFGNADGLPEDLNNSNTSGKPYDTNLPVFTVNYGQQNQNYFKDIKLDQSEFSETAESLEIIDEISLGADKRKNVMIGQNLFNVYQKRSYSCEVEMLGCALIQPMMYFQLNNIPMFRGLYLIIKVSHTIKPNSMTTTFKGVRIKKAKTPLVTASDVIMNLIGDVNNPTATVTSSTAGFAGGGGVASGGVGTPGYTPANVCSPASLNEIETNSGFWMYLTHQQGPGGARQLYEALYKNKRTFHSNAVYFAAENTTTESCTDRIRVVDNATFQTMVRDEPQKFARAYVESAWKVWNERKNDLIDKITRTRGITKIRTNDKTFKEVYQTLISNKGLIGVTVTDYDLGTYWNIENGLNTDDETNSKYWTMFQLDKTNPTYIDIFRQLTQEPGVSGPGFTNWPDTDKLCKLYYPHLGTNFRANVGKYFTNITPTTTSTAATTAASNASATNIVIGDSLVTNIHKGITEAGDSTFKVLTPLFSSGKAAENFLSDVLSGYHTVDDTIKNVVVSLGTNGFFKTTATTVEKISVKLKSLFPSAKLMIVKGNYGPGVTWRVKLKNTDQPTVNTYYTHFLDNGFYVVNPAIFDLPDAHNYAPVYKKIGENIMNNKKT